MPPLEILRPIPAVAWIPLAILMFTSPEDSMVYITFIGAFFPILLNTIHGVQGLDRRLIFASRTLGAGPVTVFREVVLPGALPSIVTGLSIGMGTSWFSLVTAEMISGQFGIGYYTWEAYTLQNYPDIVVGMIAIGVLGMLSSWLIKQAGAWCMPWLRAAGTATL
jgi:NitT/TauT family transport system permease protein